MKCWKTNAAPGRAARSSFLPLLVFLAWAALAQELAFSPTLSNILDTERGKNPDEMNSTVDLIALMAHARAAMKSNMSKAVAFQTGGEYELFESRKHFETRMMDFTNHLHSRYVLTFEPKSSRAGWHQINVRLKEPGTATVLARSSYWFATSAK